MALSAEAEKGSTSHSLGVIVKAINVAEDKIK